MTRLELHEDLELARQAAGSKEAFAQLVRRHQASVRAFLARYVPCPETADDLAQDVFLYAYQHLANFRGDGGLEAWLLGIARNKAKQHLRADVRRRERETGTLAVQLARWRLDRLEQDEDDREQTFRVLQACIERLAPESRRLVEEHYFAQQTLESIAKRRNKSGGALRMTLLRVRQALSRCIQKHKAE